MYPALNAWTFTQQLSPAEQLAAAASAGFAGIELVLAADEGLGWDTPITTFEDIRTLAADINIRITSLATAVFWDCNYASPDVVDRQQAVDISRRMLERAAACGAEAILVVPAVVGAVSELQQRVTYADAWYRTLEALLILRHDAEALGVTLAIENVHNRFLLSPLEMCDLIDQVNSPYVGVYLDVGNVLAYGYPRDWITTLSRRIARVHVKDYDLSQPGRGGGCALGTGSVDWTAVFTALRAVRYQGPLTYEGPGEPAEVCQRLKELMDQVPDGK
ncbi:MAG: sugar phosphate isomerase/epimerase family protein [Planctomycetota bacterium]